MHSGSRAKQKGNWLSNYHDDGLRIGRFANLNMKHALMHNLNACMHTLTKSATLLKS